MGPARNKSKRLSSVNRTTKTVHHHTVLCCFWKYNSKKNVNVVNTAVNNDIIFIDSSHLYFSTFVAAAIKILISKRCRRRYYQQNVTGEVWQSESGYFQNLIENIQRDDRDMHIR